MAHRAMSGTESYHAVERYNAELTAHLGQALARYHPQAEIKYKKPPQAFQYNSHQECGFWC
eukprot:83258-Rhodomonas_salina.2